MTTRGGLLGARTRRGAWAALAAALVLGNTGNVLLDGVAKAHGLSPALLLDPWLLAAGLCLGLAFLFYVKALARLPLAIAYPVLVGVSLVALTALGMLGGGVAASWPRMAGVVLVFLGIALVSKAAPSSAPVAASAPPSSPPRSSHITVCRESFPNATCRLHRER